MAFEALQQHTSLNETERNLIRSQVLTFQMRPAGCFVQKLIESLDKHIYANLLEDFGLILDFVSLPALDVCSLTFQFYTMS